MPTVLLADEKVFCDYSDIFPAETLLVVHVIDNKKKLRNEYEINIVEWSLLARD